MAKFHIVALPESKALRQINVLREFVYQHGFRFVNKSVGSDTHVTCAQLEAENVAQVEGALKSLATTLKSFITSSSEWQLVNEIKEPNVKFPQSYSWIALRFPRQTEIVLAFDQLLSDLNVNDNSSYVAAVQAIENKPNEKFLGLGDHLNLSNYTRIERAEECCRYFKENLPESITFDRITIRDEKGNLGSVVRLT